MSEADRDITTNAGRCDICGKTIDMRDGGDEMTIAEFGVQHEEVKEIHGITDQEAADAVADAMEREAESSAGYELAKVIREEHMIRVHNSCLDETNYSVLETEVPT